MKYLLIPLSLLGASTLTAQQAPQAPNMVQMFFQQMDTDQDGKVTLAEFQKPTEMQFQFMDKNKDGVVDRPEVEAFEKEVVERARQMQQQQGQRPVR